jgi:hypothetical protein
MPRETEPSKQPFIVLSQSDDPQFVCHAKIIGMDGRTMDLSIGRGTAYSVIIDFLYHLRRHEERTTNAAVQTPPAQT